MNVPDFHPSLTLRGRVVGVSALANAQAGEVGQVLQLLLVLSGVTVGAGVGLVVVAGIAATGEVDLVVLKVLALAAMVIGGVLGWASGDRVIVGPRRRSAEFRRAVREAQARRRNRGPLA